MNKNEFDNEILIDWQELFFVLWQRKVLIVLIGVICALAGLIASKFFMTPMYMSNTTAFILERNSIVEGGLTSGAMQVYSQLTKDYVEIVESRWVLGAVIEELDLQETEGSLARKIQASSEEDTRILKITVVDEDPLMAQQIADTVREKAAAHIKNVMGIEAVNVMDYANLPSAPYTPNTEKNIMIGFLAGVALTMGLICVIHVLDDTVKTPDDVERYFELSVIGSIPFSDAIADAKKTRRMTR